MRKVKVMGSKSQPKNGRTKFWVRQIGPNARALHPSEILRTDSQYIQSRESSAWKVISYSRTPFFLLVCVCGDMGGTGEVGCECPRVYSDPLLRHYRKVVHPNLRHSNDFEICHFITHPLKVKRKECHLKGSENVGRIAWVRTQLPIWEIGLDNKQPNTPAWGRWVFTEQAGLCFMCQRTRRFWCNSFCP